MLTNTVHISQFSLFFCEYLNLHSLKQKYRRRYAIKILNAIHGLTTS